MSYTPLQNVVRIILGPPRDPDRIRDPDPDLLRVSIPLVKILERYFRSKVRGLDRLPPGRALLVGNHNAGVAFLEPLLLGRAWWERTGGNLDIHALAHSTLVDLPGFGNLLTMFGAVRAGHGTAGRVFALDRKVWVFPGGAHEAFRPWRDRHRVDFGGHTGFVRLALEHRVPIVPVLCFGGHEAFFVLTRGEALARATGLDRWWHASVMPVYLGLPWGLGVGPLPHLPLPVRVVLEVGDPIPTADLPAGAERDEDLVRGLYDRVVGDLQDRMDREVAARRGRAAPSPLERHSAGAKKGEAQTRCSSPSTVARTRT